MYGTVRDHTDDDVARSIRYVATNTVGLDGRMRLLTAEPALQLRMEKDLCTVKAGQ
jgi:hypothetical protein